MLPALQYKTKLTEVPPLGKSCPSPPSPVFPLLLKKNCAGNFLLLWGRQIYISLMFLMPSQPWQLYHGNFQVARPVFQRLHKDQPGQCPFSVSEVQLQSNKTATNSLFAHLSSLSWKTSPEVTGDGRLLRKLLFCLRSTEDEEPRKSWKQFC